MGHRLQLTGGAAALPDHDTSAEASLSAAGNMFGEYPVTQVEPDGKWFTRVVYDDPR